MTGTAETAPALSQADAVDAGRHRVSYGAQFFQRRTVRALGHAARRVAGPLLPWLLVAACAAPVWGVALLLDLDLWATDDGNPHLLRIFALDWSLSRRWDYPRWIPDLYRGFGYPVFNYYPALAYYAGALLHRLAGVSIYTSFQVLAVLAVLSGASGTYALVRSVWPASDRTGVRSRWSLAGLVAAIVYVAAPYPFLTNLYLRGDLPEALTLGGLPWFLLAVHRAWHAPSDEALARSARAAALGAVLLLTHSLSALLAAAFAVVWVAAQVLLSSFVHRGALDKRFGRLLGAALVAFGATAFVCLPALGEGGAVQFDLAQHPVESVLDKLANPLGSTRATLHAKYFGARSGAVEIGWTYPYVWRPGRAPEGPVKPSIQQLAVGFAAALAFLAAAIHRRRGTSSATGVEVAERVVGNAGFVAAGVVVLAAWYLNTTWSSAIWEHVAPLRFIQFPWRLLGPLSLGLALCAGGGIAQVSARPAAAWPIASSVAIGLVTSSLLALPLPRAGAVSRSVDSSALVESEYLQDAWAGGAATGSGEFTPRAVVIAVSEPGRPRGNQLFDRLYPPGSWLGGTLLVYAGRATLLELRGSGLWREAVVDVEEGGATLAWHQLDFPGWRAFLDGQPAPIRVPPYRADEDSTLGFQLVDVPAGRHRVQSVFGTTLIRTAANAVTAMTLLVAAGVLLRTIRRSTGAVSRLTQAKRWLILGALTLAGTLALFQLAVESGRHLRVWGAPHEANRLVLDLAAAVQTGAAVLESAAGARLGENAFFDLNWLRVGPLEPERGALAHGGRERRWLYMHPPAKATFRLQVVDQRTVFQSGMALRPDSWSTPYGDGVRFIVEVARANGQTDQLYAQRLNPRAHEDERRWVEVRLPLGTYAGQEIRLTLRTEPVDDVRYDWAGWGNPLVVVDPGILRPPNGPRPPASLAAAELPR
ncbi:MAG: hypothetical protein HY332_02365 [Chloroflexi bacterium]|nr:hypothetical protein [Chloroflexota bacterium]